MRRSKDCLVTALPFLWLSDLGGDGGEEGRDSNSEDMGNCSWTGFYEVGVWSHLMATSDIMRAALVARL